MKPELELHSGFDQKVPAPAPQHCCAKRICEYRYLGTRCGNRRERKNPLEYRYLTVPVHEVAVVKFTTCFLPLSFYLIFLSPCLPAPCLRSPVSLCPCLPSSISMYVCDVIHLPVSNLPTCLPVYRLPACYLQSHFIQSPICLSLYLPVPCLWSSVSLCPCFPSYISMSFISLDVSLSTISCLSLYLQSHFFRSPIYLSLCLPAPCLWSPISLCPCLPSYISMSPI